MTLAEHPPVIGPIQVYQSDNKTQIGEINRHSAFMFRKSSTEVALQENFDYIVPYNGGAESANLLAKIYLRPGYVQYDTSQNPVFTPTMAQNQLVDMTTATPAKDMGVQSPSVYWTYDGENPNDASKTNFSTSQVLYFNGLEQFKLAPVLCVGTSQGRQGACPSASTQIDPTNAQDSASGLYNDIVYMDVSGSTKDNPMVSNFVPNTNYKLSNKPDLSTQYFSSSFEGSYLPSRYYCDPGLFTKGASNNLRCGGLVDKDLTMTAYPPVAGSLNDPSEPDYLSINSDSGGNKGKTYKPGMCLLYYHAGALLSKCIPNGGTTVSAIDITDAYNGTAPLSFLSLNGTGPAHTLNNVSPGVVLKTSNQYFQPYANTLIDNYATLDSGALVASDGWNSQPGTKNCESKNPAICTDVNIQTDDNAAVNMIVFPTTGGTTADTGTYCGNYSAGQVYSSISCSNNNDGSRDPITCQAPASVTGKLAVIAHNDTYS